MRRLHPATIVVALLPKLREAIQTAVPLLIGSVAYHRGNNFEWIAIFVGSFTGIFAIGAYFTTRFDVEPNHVVHRTGWIFRKDRRIPLEQIQNVNLRQNLLERIFRVATVDVETAMGRGRDLKLSVLALSDAESLREELLGAAHLGPSGPQTVNEPLMRLTRHDLLLGALTENHIAQMMVVMFTGTGPVIGAVTKFSSNLPNEFAPFLVVGAIMLLWVAAWVWGFVSYILKYGGFLVRLDENAFRISFGLLNKVQLVIRPRRIEYLHLTTTLPQRWMQRASFHVGTSSSFGEAGVLAPVGLFIERERAYKSASEVLSGLNISGLTWRPFEPIFYLATMTRSTVTLGILYGVASMVSGRMEGVDVIFVWTIYGFIATLIVTRVLGLILSRAENGFAITKDALVVRRGYFSQSISAIPISRMENMTIIQPFWWKKYGAASFSCQAMKRRVHVGAMKCAAVDELLLLWRDKINATESLIPATSFESELGESSDMTGLEGDKLILNQPA